MKNKLILSGFILAGLFMASCQKESDISEDGSTDITVRMTDGPGNYDQVNVDIQAIEVITESEGTIQLKASPGVYDILKLSNGKDTVIATGRAKAGKISQVRLILGENNSVMVDSVSYPLITPSAEESGLKLQLHDSLVAGVQYALLLDFDASQSIVQQGNGSYLLKPVIRIIDSAISGSIHGLISPLTIHATITAEANGVSYTTVTNENGAFLLKGIPEGTYTVTVTPDLPALPVTLTNVEVKTGIITDLQTITF
jgi:hypothetical protein